MSFEKFANRKAKCKRVVSNKELRRLDRKGKLIKKDLFQAEVGEE